MSGHLRARYGVGPGHAVAPARSPPPTRPSSCVYSYTPGQPLRLEVGEREPRRHRSRGRLRFLRLGGCHPRGNQAATRYGRPAPRRYRTPRAVHEHRGRIAAAGSAAASPARHFRAVVVNARCSTGALGPPGATPGPLSANTRHGNRYTTAEGPASGNSSASASSAAAPRIPEPAAAGPR